MTAWVGEAFAPQSVTLCLRHNIDVSRGDMIVGLENLPGMSSELRRACLLDEPTPADAWEEIFSQARRADCPSGG